MRTQTRTTDFSINGEAEKTAPAIVWPKFGGAGFDGQKQIERFTLANSEILNNKIRRISTQIK